jgi:hypothetical protein
MFVYGLEIPKDDRSSFSLTLSKTKIFREESSISRQSIFITLEMNCIRMVHFLNHSVRKIPVFYSYCVVKCIIRCPPWSITRIH